MLYRNIRPHIAPMSTSINPGFVRLLSVNERRDPDPRLLPPLPLSPLLVLEGSPGPSAVVSTPANEHRWLLRPSWHGSLGSTGPRAGATPALRSLVAEHQGGPAMKRGSHVLKNDSSRRGNRIH